MGDLETGNGELGIPNGNGGLETGIPRGNGGLEMEELGMGDSQLGLRDWEWRTGGIGNWGGPRDGNDPLGSG